MKYIALLLLSVAATGCSSVEVKTFDIADELQCGHRGDADSVNSPDVPPEPICEERVQERRERYINETTVQESGSL